jgi:hypothetical protein
VKLAYADEAKRSRRTGTKGAGEWTSLGAGGLGPREQGLVR